MGEDNRIREIRAVLDEADEKVPGVVPMSAWIYDARAFFDRIRAILDSDKAAPQSVRYHDAVATIESALKLHEGEHALPRERAHYVGRALAAAGLLADPEQGSELAEMRKERDTWESEYERVRDLKLTDLADALAERDRLQACIDAVRAVLDREWPDDEDHHDFVNRQVEDARAALQGDQPTDQPMWWGTEDGGIAAVMCSSCNTLGGHDDDCPRRQPPPLVPADQAFPKEPQ